MKTLIETIAKVTDESAERLLLATIIVREVLRSSETHTTSDASTTRFECRFQQ